ncbi:ADP-glyceromanno-heptose 6-epimerase [bacterium]|nr:ADP-glyceromanno-heptose 6-epimerase [bacterium]
MIIVTGGAGFIGSAFVWYLNQQGIDDIIVVDHLSSSTKWRNLVPLQYDNYIQKDDFLDMLVDNRLPKGIEAMVHLGACSDTTERNVDYLMENNYRYTQLLADYCVKKSIRFMYASSAATYGDGRQGFEDDHHRLHTLRPINPYGYSKHFFDTVALRSGVLDTAIGLKFFNVFGPNEGHKGGMRSVVCKAHSEIQTTGMMRLFKSYRPDYRDGEQQRDFIYVKDVVAIMWQLLQNRKLTGLYNIGSGTARTWNAVAHALFAALGRSPVIEYIDMPETIRAHYQYFTEAHLGKLKSVLPDLTMTPLEVAIGEYVGDYLNEAVGLG